MASAPQPAHDGGSPVPGPDPVCCYVLINLIDKVHGQVHHRPEAAKGAKAQGQGKARHEGAVSEPSDLTLESMQATGFATPHIDTPTAPCYQRLQPGRGTASCFKRSSEVRHACGGTPPSQTKGTRHPPIHMRAQSLRGSPISSLEHVSVRRRTPRQTIAGPSVPERLTRSMQLCARF